MPESAPLRFALLWRFALRHAGDVSILAATDEAAWIEEMYGDLWVAQHEVAYEHGIVASADEDEGRALDLQPLAIPPDAHAPRRAWAAMRLNVAGARHHGLRDEDRLADVLHGLSVADKFALADRMGVPAPSLLGLAERVVLAECLLTAPDDLLLGVRIRVAVAVPRQTGPDGLPFDYETRPLYLLQRWHVGDDAPAFEGTLTGLPGVPLDRPMDMQRLGDRLLVAEGGDATRPAALCCIGIAGLPPPADRDADWLRKLYG